MTDLNDKIKIKKAILYMDPSSYFYELYGTSLQKIIDDYFIIKGIPFNENVFTTILDLTYQAIKNKQRFDKKRYLILLNIN